MPAVGGGVIVGSTGGLGVPLGGTPAAGKAPVAFSALGASWQEIPGVFASTGTGGFNKVNGTPTILTWNTPADGNMHPFSVYGAEFVTASETGGAIVVNFTFGGHPVQIGLVAPAGAGFNSFAGAPIIADPNTTVTVQQSTALTAGGPTTLWAAILGQ